MTPIEQALAKVRALRESERKMTPGPWKQAVEDGEPLSVVVSVDRDGDEYSIADCCEGQHDTTGITAVRNAAPTMLDLLEALLVATQYDWDDPRKEYQRVEAALAAFVEAGKS